MGKVYVSSGQRSRNASVDLDMKSLQIILTLFHSGPYGKEGLEQGQDILPPLIPFGQPRVLLPGALEATYMVLKDSWAKPTQILTTALPALFFPHVITFEISKSKYAMFKAENSRI